MISVEADLYLSKDSISVTFPHERLAAPGALAQTAAAGASSRQGWRSIPLRKDLRTDSGAMTLSL